MVPQPAAASAAIIAGQDKAHQRASALQSRGADARTVAAQHATDSAAVLKDHTEAHHLSGSGRQTQRSARAVAAQPATDSAAGLEAHAERRQPPHSARAVAPQHATDSTAGLGDHTGAQRNQGSSQQLPAGSGFGQQLPWLTTPVPSIRASLVYDPVRSTSPCTVLLTKGYDHKTPIQTLSSALHFSVYCALAAPFHAWLLLLLPALTTQVSYH